MHWWACLLIFNDTYEERLENESEKMHQTVYWNVKLHSILVSRDSSLFFFFHAFHYMK